VGPLKFYSSRFEWLLFADRDERFVGQALEEGRFLLVFDELMQPTNVSNTSKLLWMIPSSTSILVKRGEGMREGR
jgi:hypothetical protein